LDTIVPAVLGGILAIVASLLSALFASRAQRGKKEETLEDRIRQLTDSLKDAAEVVSKIEAEVQQRKELVVRLQQDAETAKNIANLKKAEVDSVSQLFRGELKKEEKRSFIRDFGMNLGFFVLGVIVTYFIIK